MLSIHFTCRRFAFEGGSVDFERGMNILMLKLHVFGSTCNHGCPDPIVVVPVVGTLVSRRPPVISLASVVQKHFRFFANRVSHLQTNRRRDNLTILIMFHLGRLICWQ